MTDSKPPAEDVKFAEDFADVFGAFPKDQAIALLVRRQKELAAAVRRDALAEAAQEKWISVDTQLPDDRQDVLFACDGDVIIGSYEAEGDNCFVRPDGEVFETSDVTHWQPLPAPPAMGEKKE